MSSSGHPRAELLQALLDGELPEQERAAFEEHCRQCAECRRKLGELERLRAALAADPPPTLAASVWPSVQARLHRGPRPGFALAGLSAAACAAGVLLGLLIGGSPAGEGWSNPLEYWSGSGSTSLLDVYTSTPAEERSDGS